MQAQGQQDRPYVTHKSSIELGWSTLLAELRTYRSSAGSGPPVMPKAQIGTVLSGSGTATYRTGKNSSSAQLTRGGICLKPSGGKYDEYELPHRRLKPWTYSCLLRSSRN